MNSDIIDVVLLKCSRNGVISVPQRPVKPIETIRRI